MKHHTKDKGDLAVAKIIADLTEKEYDILIPLSEHLPFDLVAYRQNTLYRIQCKYSSDGIVKNRTSWADTNGNHSKNYGPEDFDYFALYLPDVKSCVYPSIKFGGKTIATQKPNSTTSAYWYEDFLNFTETAKKKNYKDFGIPFSDLAQGKLKGVPKLDIRKVERPSKEELEKMVWELPTTKIAEKLGVSDVSIGVWCKAYEIIKPSRGYWTK